MATSVPAQPLVLGIDLRSGPRYPTGVAVMNAARRCLAVAKVRTDDEIFALVEAYRPHLVAIDSPLGLPEGRDCADPTCACARLGIMREVDRLAAARGIARSPRSCPRW